MAWHPHLDLLATGGRDDAVRIWDPASGEQLTTFTGHNSYVNAVAWSPDGTQLATASNDRSVRIWDPTTGQPLTTFRRATTQVIGLWYGTTSDHVELVETYDLSDVAPAANEATEARRSLAEAERRAAEETQKAALQLVTHGISLRDAADILGITPPARTSAPVVIAAVQ